jgi:serine/threonine-protein kinase RCK2
MSTIQNLKNFIRHGKQARVVDPPRDHPTTNVSPVHAQQQKYPAHGISEPAVGQQKQQHYQASPPDYSTGAIGNRNVAAQAGGAAAQAAGKDQRLNLDADIHAIVTEEREKASKMPRYPGLERFILVEKMGDGAFSNVYRARDTRTGHEVAIKVVRKFEMNNNQVRPARGIPQFLCLPSRFLLNVLNFEPTFASNLGRCSPSSGFQEATKGCGGAPPLLIHSI